MPIFNLLQDKWLIEQGMWNNQQSGYNTVKMLYFEIWTVGHIPPRKATYFSVDIQCIQCLVADCPFSLCKVHLWLPFWHHSMVCWGYSSTICAGGLQRKTRTYSVHVSCKLAIYYPSSFFKMQKNIQVLNYLSNWLMLWF